MSVKEPKFKHGNNTTREGDTMSHVDQYIEDYGKELITEILDMFMINNKVDNNIIYDLLVKHKVITRRTKFIRTSCYKPKDKSGIKITIKNTSGKVILNMSLVNNDMTDMLKALSA